MARVQLTGTELERRGDQIRRMLSPLTLHRSNPAWQQRSEVGGVVVFGAYDGSFPGGPVRDWRFSTKANRIQANYYERWVLTSKQRSTWFLAQAYLTIYQKKTPETEVEILALHCDPEEPNRNQGLYKRGPHIHVSVAGPPVKDAHFALARGQLEAVLGDAESLTTALCWCVVMIRDEVLSRYREQRVYPEG